MEREVEVEVEKEEAVEVMEGTYIPADWEA